MNEVLQCPSCGGTNQLPAGKTSMFCAFCGSPIQKPIESRILKSDNNELSKSKIIDGVLAYRNRNIKSLEEIVKLYSDSELDIIEHLDLSHNQISSLKNLNRFKAGTIDLNTNNIILIDDLPEMKGFFKEGLYRITFDKNVNLTGFSDTVIQRINNIVFSNITFSLLGCKSINFDSLKKLDQANLVANETGLTLLVDSDIKLPAFLQEKGFTCVIAIDNPQVSFWRFNDSLKKEKGKISYEPSRHESGWCFIATATMGSYDHPVVMELRNFRDNWILRKKWGKGFVNWYYHYGSIASKYIEKRFILKRICYLLIVKPLYILSKLIATKK
jgi:hypothetical protein